jgi:TonB-linked SusC/RagA family outer membrane protein
MKKILMLLFSFGCCAGLFGQRTITGTVVDASDNNSPLPGVSIQIKGSSRGGATDLDGKFSLRLEADDKELVFTYLGMRAQTVAVGNLSLLHVRMEPDATVLGEVVVSALNIRREQRSLTAAQQRVNAETIAEVRDPNIVSSLAGKVAGVVVTPPTSSTGSARIVIRGNSSLTGNNQPLFVVDGMQIDNNDGSRGVNKNGGLDTGNGAADINPDDIESIDILKGPNAAALYGSRAVNGVILITTKRAQGGRFKVSVNSNAMMHYISQWPDFQNAFGVGHMSQMLGGNQSVFEQRDAAGNLYAYPGMPSMQKMLNNIATRSNGGPQIGQLYIGLDGQIHTYSPSPDNVYDFYQRAWAYTNNVSVEGGNADNNYRVSVTNYNANDVVANQNKVNKNTITGRFYNTLAKNLTLDSKITIVDDDTRNRRYANQSSFNPLYMYTIMPRTMTLDQLQHYKSDDGKETVRVGDIHNPYWTINETNNRDTKTRVMANFDLSYQIFPFLRANVKYAREFSNTRTTEFRNKGSLGGDDNNGSGYFRTQTNAYNNNMYEWMLLYNQRINDFSMIATLGGSQQNWKGSWQASSVVRLKQAGFAHLSNYDSPSDLNTDNGAVSHKRINSIYGSASVGYKDFIYLDITGRNDWSSTLPLTNCSYFYPSVGVSFIPSELFKIPSSVFYGKLRASYAQVGNDTDP